MEKTLYIFGCGGHARSIISAVRRMDSERKIVLVDDNCKENEEILSCLTMNEDVFWDQEEKEFSYIMGIGDNSKRSFYYEKMETAGGKAENVLAVSALIGTGAGIGKAVYIGEKAFVGPESKIGNDTIINTAAVVEHECCIGNHVHVAPNATICGRCKIGNYVFIGAGSIVIDKINICDNVTIGAGSVVTKDIEYPGVYAGCPVRRLHG